MTQNFNAYTSFPPIQGISRGTVEFYKPFFENSLNTDLENGKTALDVLPSLQDRQALIVLHEIGHATRKWVHPEDVENWLKKLGARATVDEIWDNAKVNQYIYDNCFKK
ncbi:MAG: hypothetical protein AB7V18_17780 [Pyrinomonadaceae bacterium]